jgi:RNA polymerase sigma-70 factor (ECF subfamily)
MTAIEFNNQIISLQNPLKYFALKLTADHEDANDLLQETLLKALRYREKFVDPTNLKAWMYTIMKNTFINNYRRISRQKTIIDNTDESYFLNISSETVSETPDSALRYEEIKREVDRLDDDVRIPFDMHNNGFKYKEIADELNMPIGTVKSRIFLARKKLTSALEDYA